MYAILLRFTRLWEKISVSGSEIISSKLGDSWYSLLVLGVFCALLVGFSVVTSHVSDKKGLNVFYTILFISSFVILGFEHIVAVFFYSSVYLINLGYFNPYIINIIIPVSIGNILGGVIAGGVCKKRLNC